MSELNNIISKPITVAREEFKQDVLKLCENSDLPIFVVEDVLKYLLEQIHIATIEQYKRDKEEYDKAIQQEKSKTE